MSKKKKQTPKPSDQHLDFEAATNLTVEEAIQKEADLAAGVTPEDSVLDKYIKKNRDKVGEQKFVNKDKAKDLSQLDTTVLDKFIEQQREELAATGLMADLSQPADQDLEETIIAPVPVAPVTDDLSKVAEIETFYGDQFTNASRKRKWIVGGLTGLILLTAGLAYGFNQLNRNTTSTQASSTSTSSTTGSTPASSAKQEDVQAFEDLYKSFFTDESLTKPKNSEFDKLAQIEEALKKLEGTSAYEGAKTKYDSLAKAIQAIQAVNDKFETPAIVDGEKVAAKLKDGATFDDLSAASLNTGRAQLDSLLQAVITEAKTGLACGSGTGSSSSTGQKDTTATGTSSSSTPSSASADKGATTSTLQREVSRVPYNQAVIADSQNPAWSFNPGVLEEILRVSRERGYITGDNYVLEPVNIINGNGYYNMFKPDGTYLFSINCKTGYFVGNGAGYADALDY